MPGTVDSVAFAPDSRTAAAGNSRGDVILFDIRNGKVTREFLAHQDEVSSIAFSPDGRSMLTGSKDRTLKVWDRSSGLMTLTIEHYDGSLFDAEFSPGSDLIVTGADPAKGFLRGSSLKEASNWMPRFDIFHTRDAGKLLDEAKLR